MQLHLFTVLAMIIVGFTAVQCNPLQENSDNNGNPSRPSTDTTMEDIMRELELNEISHPSDSSTCSKIVGPFGGTGGDPFTELPDNCGALVSRIVVWAERYVDAIQVTYRLTSGVEFTGSKHGGTGGKEHIVYLDVDNGERIISVFGTSKTLLDRIGFVTNKGRVFGPFGGPGGNSFEADSCELRGIFGSSKRLVDRIGFYCTDPEIAREPEEVTNPIALSTNPSSLEDVMKELELNERSHPSDSSTCSKIVGPFGGTGGDPFTELPDNCGALVSRIVVWAERYVDAIQVTYRLTSGVEFTGSKHGGTGGKEHIVYLDVDNGERITSVFGTSKTLLDRIGFVTNKGRVFGPFGGPGGNSFEADSCELRGIFGSSKRLVDRIGFYCTDPEIAREPEEVTNPIAPSTNPSSLEDVMKELELNERSHPSDSSTCSKIVGPFGGTGGDPFTELPDNCGALVSRIVVWAERYVDAIQVTYRLTSGVEFTGSKHGGTGGKEHIVYLDVNNGERITSVFGTSKTLLDRIGFVTNKGRVFGPFGGPGGNSFEADSCQLRGIFGSSKRLVDRIGFYCTDPEIARKPEEVTNPITPSTNPSTLEDVLKELELNEGSQNDLNTFITGPYGGSGGNPFSEIPDSCGAAVVSRIVVWAEKYVDAIQVTYNLANGVEFTGNKHGGTGGKEHIVDLDVDNGEKVIGVFGASKNLVDRIGFVTNKGRVFGPYGGRGGDYNFVESCEPEGIFGSSKRLVDRIGFYCTNPNNHAMKAKDTPQVY